MNTKHVHWAPTMTHSDPPTAPPNTPDLCHTQSTAASSLPPVTPPVTPRNILSPSTKPTIFIHPLLHYDAAPSLVWDLIFEPSLGYLRATNPNTDMTQAVLGQPATDPPRTHITVQCEDITWWKPVPLTVANMHPFITVDDVLQGVHQYLQRPVSVEEYAAFAQVPGMQDDIRRAFQERCERVDTAAAFAGVHVSDERSKGLKRVDCLLGETRFAGITRAGDDPRIWQLHVAAIR